MELNFEHNTTESLFTVEAAILSLLHNGAPVMHARGIIMSEKKTGLGRGLTSLLGEDISVVTGFKKEEKKIKVIPIEKIQPGPWQARKNFNKADLEELSLSIKSKGILSPIWVSPSNENKSYYDLIAGERRWRAAQLARIHEVPCIIFNNVDANSASVMSLIENIQRKDLNPIEEAKGVFPLVTLYL